jgi:signal peptidase II
VTEVVPLFLTAVLLADQALKALVLMGLREQAMIALGSTIRIRSSRSRSILAGHLTARTVLLLLAWLACAIAILAIGPLTGRFDSPVARAALGAALGGAASNVLDLIVRGSVVDYVEVGPWPAFNLADAAIVSGVLIGLLAG